MGKKSEKERKFPKQHRKRADLWYNAKGHGAEEGCPALDETKESNTDEFRFTNYPAALEPGKITGIQRCARRTSYMRWGMGENHDIKDNAEHFACIILRKH